MGTKEPVSSKLSKRDVQDMISQIEDANRLLAAIGTEFPHLRHDAAHVRSLLTSIVFTLEKSDQGKSEVDEDEEDGGIDYIHWINEQWWPEGATHATIDKQGGCCWWRLQPVLSPYLKYGWKERKGGELVERYYDSGMPFSGPKWRHSLRAKPEATNV